MSTTAPDRVVSVVSAPSKGGYSYVTAAVYELVARKDGVRTYRRDGVPRTARRSKRLALDDAMKLSEKLGIPLWPHVRCGLTPEQAAASSPERIAEREAQRIERIETRRIEATDAVTAALSGRTGAWRVNVLMNQGTEEVYSIQVSENTDLGCWMGNTYRSVDEALAALS